MNYYYKSFITHIEKRKQSQLKIGKTSEVFIISQTEVKRLCQFHYFFFFLLKEKKCLEKLQEMSWVLL